MLINLVLGIICLTLAAVVGLNPRNAVIGSLSRFQAFWRRNSSSLTRWTVSTPPRLSQILYVGFFLLAAAVFFYSAVQG